MGYLALATKNHRRDSDVAVVTAPEKEGAARRSHSPKLNIYSPERAKLKAKKLRRVSEEVGFWFVSMIQNLSLIHAKCRR